ncbi:glycosyltransferase [Lactococcus allomyrinae]|uniref:Glycosyltransferase n=1 Tax=Lactococcus allomyrinae TaxID=2419773 RepID=A0A387BDK8_9LACT|nr:glycosyltransferase [Lactococcus allomyrinae]AYG00588.1 glycosyltransferase [Lactococcus allomyrinae]
MIFFINSSFNEKNSGIEHAQLKRAALFRKHAQPFKLVFREWNPTIHYFLAKVGVNDEETLVMFDYFQKAMNFPEKIIQVKDLDFGLLNIRYDKEEEKGRYLIFQEQQLVARVSYFTEDSLERIRSVEYFDGFGNLYRVDFYDFRGFLSLAQWYTPDNKIGTEVWYDIYGQPILETYNRYNARKNYIKTGWRLIEDNGAIYMFSNIEELTLHFLNRLNEKYWRDEKANIFIMDRTHLADWALLNLEHPAYTVLHLHNAHMSDAQDAMYSMLNNFYEFSLTNVNGYDAIISATEKQTQDIRKRFNPSAKLFTIPVGINSEKILREKRLPMSLRKNHSILMTCRIAPEKGIDKVIEAVGIAKRKIHDITLDVYGYIDHRNQDEAKKAIDDAIEKYELNNCVHLHDYLEKEEVISVQKEHQVYALMSVMEGFNLALLEAQSHGMVTVTNDVNYGPNDLVVDKKNGYIVSFNGVEEMAEKFVTLFSNETLLQSLSTNAYDLSQRFSEERVWQAWQELLRDAATKKVRKITPIHKGIGEQNPNNEKLNDSLR